MDFFSCVVSYYHLLVAPKIEGNRRIMAKEIAENEKYCEKNKYDFAGNSNNKFCNEFLLRKTFAIFLEGLLRNNFYLKRETF